MTTSILSIFLDPTKLRDYILGGNSVFKIENSDTGVSVTYKITRKNTLEPYMVYVLDGRTYKFIGVIGGGPITKHVYKVCSNSCFGANDYRQVGFQTLFNNLNVGMRLHKRYKIYYDGKCSKCKRVLTTSASDGLGYQCHSHLLPIL